MGQARGSRCVGLCAVDHLLQQLCRQLKGLLLFGELAVCGGARLLSVFDRHVSWQM